MKSILGTLDRIPRPTPAMVVALLALLIACSGAAVAAGSYTASDGTITACRDNKTGALRVIDAASQSCVSSKETKLTWKDGFPGSTVANADKLDNKDSTDFYAAGSKVVDSAHADSATSAEDANTLDGKDSTEFLGKTEKAADSDTLDGMDSTQFATATAANNVKAGRLTLTVPETGGGQTNSDELFETAAFEIRGLCINNDTSLFNFPPKGDLCW